MTNGPRYCIYARQSISKIPEDSLSIEFQIQSCQEYVAKHGGVIVGTFTDPDTKGWKRNRPGFDAMLDMVKRGESDSVLLYKLSRFARNLMMQEEVVTEIAEAGGELVSITEPHITTSPMIRQILGAVNENYRRDQSDWLRSTFAARARKGSHHGYAPFGYRIEAGQLVPDDATAAQARQVWEWALEGHGTPEITYRLNERGWTTRNGKPWSQTTVLRVLRNPTYAGHVPFGGEVVARDTHPAIVTDAEYEQVQATIDRRSYQRRKVAPSWAEGFVWHACGRRMYLAQWEADGVQRGRFRCAGLWAGKDRPGERCEDRPASIFADVAEGIIAEACIDLVGRLVTVPRVVAALERQEGASTRERERHRTRLERRLADLEGQRQRLLDLVLQEKIDPALYGDRDATLKAEIASVRADLASTPVVTPIAEIERRTGQIRAMLDVVPAIVATDPARLVPLLTTLGARLVVGDGPPRLEVAKEWRPYFGV